MKPKGATYTVVENAGYQGETERKSFRRLADADAWMMRHYEPEEIEELHVLIRRDCGEEKTYEF